ncbi:hypothetical protein Nepgr_017598 [Nepenthes gracilis]|uniref:Uncharacterized protein n=1 Tax=Nepenthes gracilis TaxID=150966 RepID=A0AAD3SRE9_NEPGR|nr:hypothetical protein Nepgr_017598 [Nepenthes gracilis]
MQLIYANNDDRAIATSEIDSDERTAFFSSAKSVDLPVQSFRDQWRSLLASDLLLRMIKLRVIQIFSADEIPEKISANFPFCIRSSARRTDSKIIRATLAIVLVNSEGYSSSIFSVRRYSNARVAESVDFASQDDLLSKDFHGRFGKAYLFNNVVVSLGIKNKECDLISMGIIYSAEVNRNFNNGKSRIGESKESKHLWDYLVKNEAHFSKYREDCAASKFLIVMEKAYAETGKYKEGKYILEQERKLKVGW